MNFPYIVRNMLYEIFRFIRKCLHFLSNYVIILFVCLSLYLSFFPNNLQFYQISYVILNFIIDILTENLQFYHKLSTSFLNWILIISAWLSFIWIFSKKSSILYIILSYPLFYYTYVRWKSSVLTKMSPLVFSIKF